MNEQLADFYINYHDKLVAWIAARFARSREDAEELAQETYESILRYPPKETNGFVAFVYMVARKMIASYLKLGYNYWSHTPTYAEQEDLPVTQPVQDAVIYTKQIAKRVYNFLLGLPPRQYAVANAVMQEESYASIMSRLGITETNITSNWQVVLNKGRRFFLDI